jgi:GNAT superfamily N-acetyltransferase
MSRSGTVLGTAVPAELLRRCHENIVEAFRVVSRSLPGGYNEEESGVVRIATPSRGPTFNAVYLTEPPGDPASVIERSASFMARGRVQKWRLEAFPGVGPGIAGAARAAGLHAYHDMPGMILLTAPTRMPPPPAELRIREASTRPLWETMVKVGIRGLGGEPPENSEDAYPFDLSRVLRGYVGFVGRRPVGTSFSLSYHGVCGVYFVATLPDDRGKGYGTALTWKAVVGARRDGCKVSYLQASDMGAPVYERMGYRTVCSYARWGTA